MRGRGWQCQAAGGAVPPDPDRVAALPSPAFHEIEVEGRRASVFRGVAARAGRITSRASIGSLFGRL